MINYSFSPYTRSDLWLVSAFYEVSFQWIKFADGFSVCQSKVSDIIAQKMKSVWVFPGGAPHLPGSYYCHTFDNS